MSVPTPMPVLPRYACEEPGCKDAARFHVESFSDCPSDDVHLCEAHALTWPDAHTIRVIGCAAVEAALFPDQQGA